MQRIESETLKEKMLNLFEHQPDAIFTLRDILTLLELSFTNIEARRILLELNSENKVLWMTEKNANKELQFRLQRDTDPRFYDMGL